MENAVEDGVAEENEMSQDEAEGEVNEANDDGHVGGHNAFANLVEPEDEEEGSVPYADRLSNSRQRVKELIGDTINLHRRKKIQK